ncbi:hypothetical protein D3C87_607670 [compost metagenome]
MEEGKYEEDHWWSKGGESKVNKMFDPKDIAVDIRNVPVELLLRRIQNDGIDLFPAFQRRFDLWTIEAKSQLIESILLSFPIPPLYFDASNPEVWVVVDGLQRLWTLQHFVLERKFELSGLSVLSHLNGQGFDQLERQYQRKIEEYDLGIYLIRPGSPRFVIYDIFRRLNTGGVALNAQEVRHALNPRASLFLHTLVNNENFKAAVPKKRGKRMENDELALRFCAFYIQHYKSYEPPMSLFLDKAMEELEKTSNDGLVKIEEAFSRSFQFIASGFQDDKVFIRKNRLSGKGVFNKGLFEAWSVLLAILDGPYLDKLARRKPLLMEGFGQLMANPDFNESISITTASRNAVMVRFSLLEQLLVHTLK